MTCWSELLQRQYFQGMKDHFQQYAAYRAVRSIKRAVGKHFNNHSRPVEKVVSLASMKQPARGNALLSFINEPFLLTPDQAGMYGQHTHYWAVVEIAQAFLDFGYNVDIIRWNNETFIPRKEYNFFIDFRMNLERLNEVLGKDCTKIMYIETAHWLFHMKAQYNRLFAIQQRRGVTLSPYKTLSPNLGIEYADCATVLGNNFTINTYKYACKPLYRVPVISPITCEWPVGKDFDACRRQFLWFGSGGLVHKGLDLVLEAFSDLPNYHLTVCGPIQQEKDFEKAFFRELYLTPNIHTRGWVNASSTEFVDIANRCIGLIYPSCSEGGGGSVATAMHAGLIPIISYESSVDIADNFGLLLRSCSIEAIKDAVQTVSALPSHDLKQMARNAWESARTQYTRENFTVQFQKALTSIMEARR